MSPYTGEPRHLLLVEDETADADLIRRVLGARLGERDRVTVVECLSDAVAMLTTEKLDAVLLDLRLPDAEGVECVRAVRAVADQVPVVVLTGTDDEELAIACIDAGAQDYLPKGQIRSQDLLRAIRYAIARCRETAAARSVAELRSRLAAIVESSCDAIVSSTPDGVITSWNLGAAQIFGYAADEAIGRPVADVMRPLGDEAEAEQRLRVVRAGSDLDSGPEDVVRLRKDGTRVTLSVMSSQLTNASGELVGLAAICRDVTVERQQARDLAQRNHDLMKRDSQMRALTVRLNAIREEERTRISREVHDELGQLLTGLKMDLRWMVRRLKPEAPLSGELFRGKLAEMEGLLDTTIRSVQRIGLELRPSALDTLGLPEAIRDEARRFQARTSIPTEVRVVGEPRPGTDLSSALFRIFQELLTNIARHAKAGAVRVVLGERTGALTLVVEDDGVGMPVEAEMLPSSLGLLGMRERTEAFGGSLTFSARPGTGTIATAHIPTLRAEKQTHEIRPHR